MRLRSVILASHRWMGLATAGVLSIVGSTGAFLIWPSYWRLEKVVKIAGRLHEELAMGQVGRWIVIYSTVVAVVILLGGVCLWWKRKIVAIETRAGWRRMLSDLHHSLGVLGFAMMLLIALTGVGMAVTSPDDGELRRIIFELHTTKGYPFPVKLVYAAGTTAFLVQSVTGVVMWWGPKQKRS